MPIDLYKLSGLDYRDKTREAKLAVDSDVERARRVGEIQRAAEIEHAQKLEGIARRRFVENYAKTLEAGGQTEGIGEDAEAAWAQKVASGDLKDVEMFRDTAGRLPGAEKLSRSKTEVAQGDLDIRQQEQKVKMLETLGTVAALLGFGGGFKGAAKRAEKQLDTKQKEIDSANVKAGTDLGVNKALEIGAAAAAVQERENRLAGQQLGLLQGTNDYEQKQREYLDYPADRDLRVKLLEEQIEQSRYRRSVPLDLREDSLEAQILRNRAAARAADAKAGGARNLGIGTAGQPLKKDGKVRTADDLIITGPMEID